LHAVAKVATLFVLYVSVAKLGLMLDAVSGFATLVWAPTGIALAALLMYGQRLWPSVWLGAFAVNLWAGAPWLVAIGIACGNTLEAVLGAYALRRLGPFQGSFDRLRQVMVLIVLVAGGTTLVSATIGVATLRLGGIVSPAQFLRTWQAWWVGDILGDLVVAPLLLAWATLGPVKLQPRRLLEGLLLGGAVALASLAVFFRPAAATTYPFEWPYALFPLFVWAAVRFALPGAATATALASGLAIWGTTRGSGPFVRQTLAESLLGLQTFMGSAALTPLVVAGAISDRARAIAARESFVAAVSHDLKNPLNAIRMSAQSLGKALPEDIGGGRVQTHERLVLRAVDRMTRLVGDLLDAAAIDAGSMSVDLRDENVRNLVTEATELLRPLATARKLTLGVEVGEEFRVLCDHARVLQVLSNLIGNAIKFSDEGTDIVVRAERMPRVARFSVRDHGIGIEPGQLRHIFERYWHSRSTAGGGSGLGLFLSKGIVQAHGGNLWAESKVGAGSTFYFTLPLREDTSGRNVVGSEGPSVSGGSHRESSPSKSLPSHS
jgi:signal transduction histidine kinase